MDDLVKQYEVIKKSTSYQEHSVFIKSLLSEKSLEVIKYHYNLLKNQENRSFYLQLRAAFVKRGEAGENFLISQIEIETDQKMKADILHLLGRQKWTPSLTQSISIFK